MHGIRWGLMRCLVGLTLLLLALGVPPSSAASSARRPAEHGSPAVAWRWGERVVQDVPETLPLSVRAPSLSAVVALAAGVNHSLALASACTFTLGFQALHALLPEVVDPCITAATPQPNGDMQQRTTQGRLVWRKADNLTAFTDEATTWILGPAGLQSRPNDQRFAWEAPGA
jgi:hypothetical protein